MIELTAVAVHALHRAGEISGRNIVVLGAGPIDNLVGQAAKGLGARAILMTDVSDFRLAKAKACGIEFTVNTGKEDLNEAILKYFGSERADLMLECVGVETTMTQAIAWARKGSTIVVVGVFGKKPVVALGLVQDRELSLIGTLMYQRQDYEKAIELTHTNAVCLEPLITDRFPFSAYLDAYHHIIKAKDRAVKVMITLD